MAKGQSRELETCTSTPEGSSSGVLRREDYDEALPTEKELRLVIFGKTGTGKSSTGNTILGYEGFKKNEGHGAETKHCRKRQVKINGRNVTIVDTPGVSDPLRDPRDTLHEISRCLLFVMPGPHALLFVVNANARFTEEEENAYDSLRKIFASNLNSYVIVLFTHFDEFGNKKERFEEKLKQYGRDVQAANEEGRKLPDIHKVLIDVREKMVLFSNTADPSLKDQQVLQLLDVIQDLADSNHMPFFEDKQTAANAQQLEKIVDKTKKEDYRRTSSEVWTKVKASKEAQKNDLLKALEPRGANQGYCTIL